MKKFIITTICASVFALSGCEKKNESNNPSSNTTEQKTSSSLSTNNVADIKSDFEAVSKLSSSKSEEALKLQEEAQNASASKDGASSIANMQDYFKKFNSDLDSLNLKSTEVSQVRSKMISLNNLTFEMVNEGLSSTPNVSKIQELQGKLATSTQELSQEMQALEAKIK